MEIKKRKGIDASTYQRNINWSDVKADGVEFAIIRAGYGQNTIDKQVYSNINGCIENGIDIGVYWFIYGINEKEAIANADMCHSVISPYREHINMKVWCDLEYDTENHARKRGVVFTKQQRTNMVKAFCERMKSYGYEVGVYTNQDYLKNKFGDLSMYPLWLARYCDTKGNYDCELWQYTSRGSVKGIEGNVDMNIHFTKVEEKPNTVIEPMQIEKGDTEQFVQIVCNIKTALNTDFGLKFIVDGSVNEILLANLGNANLSVLAHTSNLTYSLTQLLAWWGYPIAVTDKYTKEVAETITTFQWQTDIVQTGIMTGETWSKLLGK